MFKRFRGDAASTKPPFWGFFFSPKYGASLQKFRPEVFSHKTKTVFKQSFKIKCLSRNGRYPLFKVLVHIQVHFIPGKPKILSKTRIFPETASLWLLSNTSTRSQINHRIHTKLIKKSRIKIKNRPLNKNQEVRGQVRTTFSEAPNSGLTIGQKCFVVARLKLVLFKFWCHFFFFLTPFFDCGPVFRGDTQPIEKNILDFQMQNFMLNLLNKKII